MAKISNSNNKPDESVLENIYYYHLWKNRLGWTRHIIPVRAFDAGTGFFVEAYASIVSAISDLEEQKIELKLGCLPTQIFDTIFVKITDIYPTARNLSLIKDNKIMISPKSDKFLPFIIIPVTRLNSLFKVYKGCRFTLRELENMLNNPIKDKSSLVEDGTKHCSIDAEETTAYSGVGSAKVILDAVDLGDVHDSFTSLYEAYSKCVKCELGTRRKERNEGLEITTGRLGANPWMSIVKGATADVMFIGEAPGIQEEKTGIAFTDTSPSGQVLKKVLDASGLEQNKCFYTNAVLCRPYIAEKEGKNGKPEPEHIKACNKRLKNELALLNPKVIVLLGKIAYRAFYGEDPSSILRYSGWKGSDKNIYLAPHPSFVARELSFAEASKTAKIKGDYLNHFKQVKNRLDELKS